MLPPDTSKDRKGEMFYFWVYVGGKGVEKY
jgi:hypothetical protein